MPFGSFCKDIATIVSCCLSRNGSLEGICSPYLPIVSSKVLCISAVPHAAQTQTMPAGAKVRGCGITCGNLSNLQGALNLQNNMSHIPCFPFTNPPAKNQWEFQDPKMEVLYYIRLYFVGVFPYIALRLYMW